MRRRYEEKRREWDERLRPEEEAIERAERLTAADYAVHVGAPQQDDERDPPRCIVCGRWPQSMVIDGRCRDCAGRTA